jgi:bacteriochlorophyllide a dehydrogenase
LVWRWTSRAVGVDTVGSPEATESLVPLLKHFGHIVSAGFCGTNDRISLQSLRDSELPLDSVANLTPGRMDATVAAIADGTLKTLPLITHQFPVSRAAEAWKLIESGDRSVMGVILDW